MQVIPYGIEDRSEDGPPDAEDLVTLERLGSVDERALCIGTIGARKNQRLLVEALAQPALRSATAVFVGDGDRRTLLDEARALGVADRIAILGYRPRASRYLTCGRVLVLPSRNEGLPLASPRGVPRGCHGRRQPHSGVGRSAREWRRRPSLRAGERKRTGVARYGLRSIGKATRVLPALPRSSRRDTHTIGWCWRTNVCIVHERPVTFAQADPDRVS